MVLNKKGEILLTQRHDLRTWVFPGGMIAKNVGTKGLIMPVLMMIFKKLLNYLPAQFPTAPALPKHGQRTKCRKGCLSTGPAEK